VTLPPRSTRGPRVSCFDGAAAEGTNRLQHRVVFMQDCLPWRRRFRDVDHVVLREGFAPLGEFGARLQLVSADPGYSFDAARCAAARDEGCLPPVGGTALLPRPDPHATIDSAIYGVQHRGTITADDWVTVVRAERDYASAPPVTKSAALPPAWTLFLAALGVVT